MQHTKHHILTITLILFSVFLLTGGFNTLKCYIYGAETYPEYRATSTAPFYAGAILMGAYGLMYAYKNRHTPQCLIGLIITIFCYAIIEYVFNAV